MSDIIDFSSAGFTRTFDVREIRGYASIHMEMFREGSVLKGTGTYCIYCLHPEGGSCYFTIRVNNQGRWYSNDSPSFIDHSFIAWLGDEINKRNF